MKTSVRGKGFALSLGRCTACSQDLGTTPYIIIACILVLALLAWYFLSWRPLLIRYEVAVCALAGKCRSVSDSEPQCTSMRGALVHK